MLSQFYQLLVNCEFTVRHGTVPQFRVSIVCINQFKKLRHKVLNLKFNSDLTSKLKFKLSRTIFHRYFGSKYLTITIFIKYKIKFKLLFFFNFKILMVRQKTNRIQNNYIIFIQNNYDNCKKQKNILYFLIQTVILNVHYPYKEFKLKKKLYKISYN